MSEGARAPGPPTGVDLLASVEAGIETGVGDLVGEGRRPSLHKVTLAFADPETERAYWAHFAGAYLGYFRVGVLFVGALLVAFAPADTYVFPEVAPRIWLLRYGFAFVGLSVFGLHLWSEQRRERYRTHVQELLGVAAVGCLAGTCGGGMVALGRASTTELYVAALGMLVAIEFLFGFSRLRFVYALPLAVVSLVVVYVAELVRADAPPIVHTTLGIFSVLTLLAGAMISYTLELYSRLDFIRERELQAERELSEQLLHNILPREIAGRLVGATGVGAAGGRGAVPDAVDLADRLDEVSVLFADLVDFTPLAERLSPDHLVEILDRIFSRFDELADRYGVEKIKTIGDAYMVAAGVPRAQPDHAERLARLALEMRWAIAELEGTDLPGLGLRIGLHCGPVLAGVIGRRKFCYDLWGDTVNTAARMESHGRAGRIQVTAAMRARLEPGFALSRRGEIEVKGKGCIETWWLDGVRSGDDGPGAPSPPAGAGRDG